MTQLADRIAVMYAGRLVEVGAVDSIVTRPLHPYTSILVNSAPGLRQRRRPAAGSDIGGIMHDPRHPPSGCIFRLRCPYAQDVCREQAPSWQQTGPANGVACHFAGELELAP
jgi:oligopeptide/dipeptide ABC transporter ATP-binding protein